MRSGRLKTGLVVLGHVVVWGYSGVHFLATGVLFALRTYSGDFLGSFPARTIVTWINRPDLFVASASYVGKSHLGPRWWGYGPGMHLVTFPLLFLPTFEGVYRVWLFVNYGFLAVACWLLYRLAFPGRAAPLSATLFWFLVLNYYPLYEALIQRNIEIFELFLIVGAMKLYSRRRDALAGGLIGFGAMTKFLPGIFVPYFVLKGRWRAAWTALVVIGILAILAEVTLGWQDNSVFILLRKGDPSRGFAPGGYTPSPLNQSVSGPVLRVERWAGFQGYGIALSQAITVVLGAALCWVMVRFRSKGNWQIEWSLLVVAMIMLLPRNENYYLAFLLIPYAMLLGMVERGAIPGWHSKAMIAASFVLTGWPVPLSLLDRVLGRPAWNLLLTLSIPVWGVALLVVVLVETLWGTSAVFGGRGEGH